MDEHNNSSDRLSLFDFQDVFKGVRKLLPLFLALLVLISAVLCIALDPLFESVFVSGSCVVSGDCI